MKYVNFPWPVVVAALPISKLCFLFTRARKLLFLVQILLMIRGSAKEIAQHQA
jgi:hypothetical protein